MKGRKRTNAIIELVILMFPLPDNSKTMHVASQALATAEKNPRQGSLNSLMKEMFAKFKTS